MHITYPPPYWKQIIPRALVAFLLRTVRVDTAGSEAGIPVNGAFVCAFAPHCGWIDSIVIDGCFLEVGRPWPFWLTKGENRTLPEVIKGDRVICMDQSCPELSHPVRQSRRSDGPAHAGRVQAGVCALCPAGARAGVARRRPGGRAGDPPPGYAVGAGGFARRPATDSRGDGSSARYRRAFFASLSRAPERARGVARATARGAGRRAHRRAARPDRRGHPPARPELSHRRVG